MKDFTLCNCFHRRHLDHPEFQRFAFIYRTIHYYPSNPNRAAEVLARVEQAVIDCVYFVQDYKIGLRPGSIS